MLMFLTEGLSHFHLSFRPQEKSMKTSTGVKKDASLRKHDKTGDILKRCFNLSTDKIGCKSNVSFQIKHVSHFPLCLSV
jgi:hypothetical protein